MAALPYIQLYVSDYLADTAHLSTLENGAYLLLIFNYWQRGESFKANDQRTLNKRLASVARMSIDEWETVKETLAEFFEISETEWKHSRIERDLEAVNSKSNKAREAGKASASSKYNERSTNVQRTFNHTDTDTDTDTEKEKKKNIKKENATATRLPADWQPSENDIQFCKTNRPDLEPKFIADHFRDYWTAQPGAKGRKLDWPATWRNWVRNQKQQSSAYQSARSKLDEERRRTYENLTGRSSDRDITGEFTVVVGK